MLLIRDNNLYYLFISFLLAFFGSYSASGLAEQYRISRLSEAKTGFRRSTIILILVAMTIEVAIFGTHFIGMGSLILTTQDSEVVTFDFSTGLTVASIIASLLCIYLGLMISSRDRAYTKSKEGIAEMTVSDASNMIIKEIKETNFVSMALCKEPYPIILGGFIATAGILVMHYIGMMAMVFQGTMIVDTGLVAASVVIAIVASIAAFWILFRLLAIFPNYESFRFLGSIVMAVAINGMHYTGAAAVNYDYNPNSVMLSYNADRTVPSSVAVFIALAVSILFLFLISFMISLDLRAGTRKSATVLTEIDALVKGYHNVATRNHEKSIDIESFIRKYDCILSGSRAKRDTNPSSSSLQSPPVIKPHTQAKPHTQVSVHAITEDNISLKV
jgi:NO-binding membrane sensor protein with MHYT domain